MPRQRFDRAVTVDRPPQAAWDAVTDVGRLVSWISILSDVEEHQHLARYSAVLSDRIGPFSLNADLDIEVTGLDPGRSISLQAEGRDRAVDSRIFIEGTLTITPEGEAAQVAIEGHYEVTGKVATFGGPMIRSRAERIVEDFFIGLSDELG